MVVQKIDGEHRPIPIEDENIEVIMRHEIWSRKWGCRDDNEQLLALRNDLLLKHQRTG